MEALLKVIVLVLMLLNVSLIVVLSIYCKEEIKECIQDLKEDYNHWKENRK